jgi:hypothetical protein
MLCKRGFTWMEIASSKVVSMQRHAGWWMLWNNHTNVRRCLLWWGVLYFLLFFFLCASLMPKLALGFLLLQRAGVLGIF